MSEAVDGAGTVTARQLYLPYGGSRYTSGTMPTSKGYTGQRADAATGLDYYGARYYDPVVGQFTSADDVLPGDGLDPWGLAHYAYVEGNPIARNDPTGHCPWCIGFVVGAIVGAAIAYGVQVYANHQNGVKGWDIFTSNIDPSLIAMGALDGAFIGASLGVGVAVAGAAIGEGATVGTAAYLGGSAAATDYFYGTYRAGQIEEGDDNEFAPLTKPASAAGDCGESFSSDTLVTTPTGETPIGHLQVGDPVVAYDPQAKAASTQQVEHVFIDHDTDLLDLTLHKDQAAKTASAVAGSQNGRSSKDTASDEVVHTTASHPWLTADSGWVRAGKLHVGERVVRADGSSAVVAAIQVIPGAANMYDLTVSNVHTFIVGTGQYVVHNCPETWGNPSTLTTHYNDHGQDLGATSEDDYADKASQFFRRSQREGWPTKVDADGVRRVKDPNTNMFGSFNPNGTTRTVFMPTSPTYFERQPGHEPHLFW